MGAMANTYGVGLTADLVGAVSRGEIVAYFQPQVDVATRRVVGVEALSRWKHPRLGLVPPMAFIPIAEEKGFIHEIGNAMLEEGLRCADEWNTSGYDVDVSVNVSAMQLTGPRFFNGLVERIERLALPRGRLTLEITESHVITSLPEVAARLGVLRDHGIGISIDDFGTGHSSVSQLLNLPTTEVKLDQSLIRAATPTNDALLAALVGLVKDRGLRVVAEGVETEEQFERVRIAGCDRAQGYLFGHATTCDEVETLFTR